MQVVSLLTLKLFFMCLFKNLHYWMPQWSVVFCCGDSDDRRASFLCLCFVRNCYSVQFYLFRDFLKKFLHSYSTLINTRGQHTATFAAGENYCTAKFSENWIWSQRQTKKNTDKCGDELKIKAGFCVIQITYSGWWGYICK